MILVIDNYDSFVHNLARYFREAGAATRLVRNDTITVDECLEFRPEGVVISPGPKRPGDAGISLTLIEALPATTPLLGVCLGHQCLVEAFGGRTERASRPLHGEASLVYHEETGLFERVPSPMPVGRYHSLIAHMAEKSALIATAWSEEGEVMAVAHRDRPWFGVQFHPESLLTAQGRIIIANFLGRCGQSRAP